MLNSYIITVTLKNGAESGICKMKRWKGDRKCGSPIKGPGNASQTQSEHLCLQPPYIEYRQWPLLWSHSFQVGPLCFEGFPFPFHLFFLFICLPLCFHLSPPHFLAVLKLVDLSEGPLTSGEYLNPSRSLRLHLRQDVNKLSTNISNNNVTSSEMFHAKRQQSHPIGSRNSEYVVVWHHIRSILSHNLHSYMAGLVK